ncbi:ABC transporter ATP-binding protein [Pasteuria penetrans]|uniref:ABC transporter ATP-binding protein n=1 Tax=Pasteuria penetrans TaxID=86005 RepID=UPI000F952BA6|nr:ABC transporter ATP-binding protein [Pasteuria penetrans]
MEYAVEMKGITKRFAGTVANEDVDLRVRRGSIHALLGENGAGKSTLMNILYGVYQPDEGEIWIQGQRGWIKGPAVANRLGIGMVHQHFTMVRNFTVAENVVLGHETTRWGCFSSVLAEKRVQDLAQEYGLEVDVKKRVDDLSVATQQIVEILKVLHHGADILILDEPTAILSSHETDVFLCILQRLSEQGKTIIFITHKLKEIMRVCSDVTVLRRGRNAGSFRVRDVTEEKLAACMVGSTTIFRVEKEKKRPGRLVLEVEDLVVEDSQGALRVNGCNLDVCANEIVGLLGVAGNGQRELVEAITGLRRCREGSIRLLGKEISNLTPRQVMELGVSHIPEDRCGSGLVPGCNVIENMILRSHDEAPFSHYGFLRREAIREYGKRLVSAYDIRASSLDTPVGYLSGGNQQKVVVARELDRDSMLLIAVQPTRGVDVKASTFIRSRLVEYRDRGHAVLLVSLESEEVLQLSDRLAIMTHGEIVGWVDDTKGVSHEEIGLLMAGRKQKTSVGSNR